MLEGAGAESASAATGGSPPSHHASPRDGGDDVLLLKTDVQPAQADHSFAGVVFDVATLGDWEATIHSVHVSGQLGSVSVYAAAGGWCPSSYRGGVQRAVARSGWGNANDMIDPSRWELVARVQQPASWHKRAEILLQTPVRVLPGTAVGIYIHTNAENDGGLIYQSCARSDRLGSSEHLVLLPGLGHTSSTPFGTEDGWWASSRQQMRGPAGAVGYTARRRFWSAGAEAAELPLTLRAAVREVLLCHARGGIPLSVLPKVVLYAVLERCTWSWFEPLVTEEPHWTVATDALNGGSKSAASSSGEEEGEASSDDDDDDDDGEARSVAEETADLLMQSERQAWRDQRGSSHQSQRSGGNRSRGRAMSASEEARAVRQQQLERKKEKQERRDVERRARTAWQRMPSDAPHHIRMAAAHQAARVAVVRPAAAALTLDEPEPEPELEPELETEPTDGQGGAAVVGAAAVTAAALLPEQLRVTVTSEAGSAGGKAGKGRRGVRNMHECLCCDAIVL